MHGTLHAPGAATEWLCSGHTLGMHVRVTISPD
jgi:hypothetical protein